MHREQEPTIGAGSLPTPAAMERQLQRWEPLIRKLARRFAISAECEDLEQVARFALWQAALRFDPERGCQFYTFALPTIVGALRRYIRDRRSVIRVPRRCWDLCHRLKRAADSLAQALEREPSILELSVQLGVSEEEVAGAMNVPDLMHPLSLDQVYEGSEGESTQALADRIGAMDPVFEVAEQRIAVRQAMESLPTELKEILELRYFQGLTPQEVARKIGKSHIQVSRLERRALMWLRQELREAFDLRSERPDHMPRLPGMSSAAIRETRSHVAGR